MYIAKERAESELIDYASALAYMKKGKCKCARAGWNGEDMMCFYVPGSEFEVNRAPLNEVFEEGTPIKYHGHVDMMLSDGSVTVWSPTMMDITATDWFIITEGELDLIKASRMPAANEEDE